MPAVRLSGYQAINTHTKCIHLFTYSLAPFSFLPFPTLPVFLSRFRLAHEKMWASAAMVTLPNRGRSLSLKQQQLVVKEEEEGEKSGLWEDLLPITPAQTRFRRLISLFHPRKPGLMKSEPLQQPGR